MMTDDERRERHNAEVLKALAGALTDGRYVPVTAHTRTVHAARSTMRGYNGYIFPRMLCAPGTPRHFASLCSDTTTEVTCKRCLSSIAARTA